MADNIDLFVSRTEELELFELDNLILLTIAPKLTLSLKVLKASKLNDCSELTGSISITSEFSHEINSIKPVKKMIYMVFLIYLICS